MSSPCPPVAFVLSLLLAAPAAAQGPPLTPSFDSRVDGTPGGVSPPALGSCPGGSCRYGVTGSLTIDATATAVTIEIQLTTDTGVAVGAVESFSVTPSSLDLVPGDSSRRKGAVSHTYCRTGSCTAASNYTQCIRQTVGGVTMSFGNCPPSPPSPDGGGPLFQVTDRFGVFHNNVPLNNGGDAIFIFSSPSSGASVGTDPPDITGDLFWKTLPGDTVMNHAHGGGGARVMEVDGYHESLFDSFWGTTASPASSSADFYDRSHGLALPSTVNPGNLEPAFIQLGLTTEILVSVGNSGFGNPCTVAPSLCSPPGSTCPPTGFVNGYIVDLFFSSTTGTGIPLLADGTAASNRVTTYYVPGGMTATGGVCGLGDYSLQDEHSTDETQADILGGISRYGGRQLGGGGPIADLVTDVPVPHLAFRELLVNKVADSGGGGGIETGSNGGGGLNAANLTVSGGTATLATEIRDFETAAGGGLHIAIAGSSLIVLPLPVPALGAYLLILPDPVFNATSSIWQGAVSPSMPSFTSEGIFSGAHIPIPAGGVGLVLNTQGLVFDLATFTARTTNVKRSAFHP